MAGAKLKAWHALRAKERQLAALTAGNKTRHGRPPVMENLPEPDEGDARDHAAAAVGVSGRSVDDAEKVMREAVPEVARLVESGAMTLNEALKGTRRNDAQRRQSVP